MIHYKFYEETGLFEMEFEITDNNDLLCSITRHEPHNQIYYNLNKKELHSLIGLLLHIQAKMK